MRRRPDNALAVHCHVKDTKLMQCCDSVVLKGVFSDHVTLLWLNISVDHQHSYAEGYRGTDYRCSRHLWL